MRSRVGTGTGLLLVSLVAAAAGACESGAPVPPVREAMPAPSGPHADGPPAEGTAADAVRSARPRIVFLGDSLTAGYGLDTREAVPALVQRRLDREGFPYEVVNAGVSGDTSAGGLSRLDWALDGDVRLLVIELGANDGLRGLPVENMKRNLDAIITRAKARGIGVLLTGMEAPPNYGDAYTREFRAVFPALASAHGVAFLPFYLDGVAGVPDLNIGDGIHPNPEGARRIEQSLWRVLRPLLERPAQS